MIMDNERPPDMGSDHCMFAMREDVMCSMEKTYDITKLGEYTIRNAF